MKVFSVGKEHPRSTEENLRTFMEKKNDDTFTHTLTLSFGSASLKNLLGSLNQDAHIGVRMNPVTRYEIDYVNS